MLDLEYTDSIRELFSAKCRPPPLPSPDASAPSSPWVLLEPLAYVSDVTNGTTAEASSSTSHTIQVTVCLTDPLGVSYVCVYYPGFKEADFAGRPTVVSSEKDLLLISVSLLSGPSGKFTGGGITEYFVYKAGPGRPSLRLIPEPYPRVLTASEIGLVPLGDDGSHFVLAVMCFTLTRWVYQLHLFSSMTWAWSIKVPQADVSSAVETAVSIPVASKVLQLGGGTLGWVDLWKGILVCNVLDEMPVVRFILLPLLMPGNEGPKTSPWPLRDVACSNGLIKFIELENNERPDVDERSYDDMDILYESDCLKKPKKIGWRIMTWYRMTSWNHWRKGCMAYDEEISVDYPSHSMLLPLLDDNARVLTLKDVVASYPVLSLNCHYEDVIYLVCKSKSKSGDQKEWLITVDLRKKILIELAPFSVKRYFSPAHPCVLSNYLNIAPATGGTSEGP